MLALYPLTLAPAALALRTATGGTETLYPARDRRATVVVVVLAECPIARQYSPELIRLSKEYAVKGIRFAMAFADGEPKAWRAQMREFGLTFPAVRADRHLVGLLGAVAVPTAAVVAADGTIVYSGRIDDRYPALGVQREVRRRDLRLALNAFLASKPVRPSRTVVVGCALPTG